ncbi:MAG: single-stranded-DNA-specific exonuclease RecJ [Sulfurovaceae bacterium]|nr:single-stranded-DNA-specific exonuclease RecJ [Sulfurovaceae bacterium]
MKNSSELTLEQIESHLKKRFEESGGLLNLSNLPHPSMLKDMDKACERIVSAIQNKEKITIIGDYDVDGITSTALMILFFEEINYPIKWIIPNRFKDGYGLSVNIVSKIKGTDLAITVDNGISAIQAAELCKKEGIELIITDHHLLSPEIPKAYAIINQKQKECPFPYFDICGAQIAWYLIASLKNALNIKIDLISYLEFVSIAIIADMMPLQHINRAMVQAGMKSLSKSTKPSIRAFLEFYQKEELSSEDIAFFFAPILNSAGRMDDASNAVEFLSSTNIYDANKRLERLIEFNALRKTTEHKLMHQVMQQVKPDDNVIIVSGRDWHEGVVGIVAARVAQTCQKPSIVLSENTEKMLKGSGRSFGECDLFGIIDNCRDHLEKFGGHQAAIGLSLHKDKLEIFRSEVQKLYKSNVIVNEIQDPEIIGELKFDQIGFALINLIKKYEPYGYGNPVPKFVSKNVEIIQLDTMGKEEEHMRFVFMQEGIIMHGVKFKAKKTLNIGQKVTLLYTINENNYRGKKTQQLIIKKIV